jgi:maltooligosyltrehalose synthase
VIAVTPRLVAGLTGGEDRLPLGQDTWGTTWLVLTGEDAGNRYRNLLTGEELTAGECENAPGFPLATICAHFPVALLERIG